MKGIYHSNDVRGIRQQQITPQRAYQRTHALIRYLDGLDSVKSSYTILLGNDARAGNAELVSAAIDAISEAGHTPILIDVDHNSDYPTGIVSTPVMYHLVQHADAAMIWTASHNPPEYVGVKVCDHQTTIITPNQMKSFLNLEQSYSTTQQIDHLHYSFVHHPHLQESLTQWKKNHISTLSEKNNLTIVVDYGGAATVTVEKGIFEQLEQHHTIIHLNESADSSFSAHLVDTENAENYVQLQRAVLDNHADLGILFDGDGDRIGFVDEQGSVILGDHTIALMVNQLLVQHPGADIAYELNCTQSVPDIIQRLGGVAHRERVGYSYIKQTMRATKSIFGGETSGHYLFADYNCSESPLTALALIMGAIGESSLSALIAPLLQRYKGPKQYLYDVNRDEILTKVKTIYKEYAIEELDGVTVQGDSRRFNIRGSNTEPKMKITIEAVDHQEREKVKDRLLKHLAD